MHEQGRDGEGPLGPPKGEPGRPLIEASALFLAFYLASYIFAGSSPDMLSKPGYHLAATAVNLPRAVLLLYLMAAGDGLRAFSVFPIRPKDSVRGLLCSLGAFAVMLVPDLLFSALGVQNDFLVRARSGPRGAIALAPLILVSSMATGYCEELFFRAYLLRRLGQAGVSPIWAAIASAILFGMGHGYQGIIGLSSGGLLGLFFAWRWNEAKNIHEIAIGHGLFDAAVFSLALYS
jgi:hypothetical protein